jgi:hypothetical protein
MLSVRQEDAPLKPFVRFQREAVENKSETLRQGHYVATDVDYVFVTPPYSKDIFKQKVAAWFSQIEQDAQNQRIPSEWVSDYKKAYDYFKKGQELPLDGIAIKGWGVISPAQQETLIKMHILTVEQLAAVNDEGLKRIGMGSVDLKNKAKAWLLSLKKSGSVSIEIAQLKKENEELKKNLEILMSKFEALPKETERHSIEVDDLLDDYDAS